MFTSVKKYKFTWFKSQKINKTNCWKGKKDKLELEIDEKQWKQNFKTLNG